MSCLKVSQIQFQLLRTLLMSYEEFCKLVLGIGEFSLTHAQIKTDREQLRIEGGLKILLAKDGPPENRFSN